MELKELSKNQLFILLLVGMLCLTVVCCVIWFVTHDVTYTFHISMDNNTLEAFKTIDYTKIN